MTDKDTKTLLLNAAKKVFAEKGFNGATVKEIADEAGVNISLVSYHFEGKENLYVACFKRYTENKAAIAERILRNPESYDDVRTRLTLFAQEILQDAIEEPEVCMILHRDALSANSMIKDVYQGSFLKAFETFVSFLTTAQKKKILRSDFDADHVAVFFMGGLVHNMRIDPLRKELTGQTLSDPKFRDKLIKNAVELTLRGTASPAPS